jgi:microsomal dipeptidase-like Zn-dependent dipeptidase
MTLRRALGAAALVLALLAIGFYAAGPRVEAFANRLSGVALVPASDEALALHRASDVVDLHADTLLWPRSPLARGRTGHVDLPRLRAGGVGLQVFTIVTRVPVDATFERTDADSLDAVTLLALSNRWPAAAVRSLTERALYQARKLEAAAEASGGDLVRIESRGDLERLLRLRAHDPNVVGAILGVEGAHALGGDLENLQPLFDAGVRVIGLAHFFDNAFAGSAHGVRKHGLTPLGRELIRRMEELGILVDLAHASPAAIDEALAIGRKPPVVSHTGVQATCPGPRNLSDRQVRAIAAKGGVIGIAYFPEAVCGTSPERVARAIRHVVDLVGDEHVALGSDWDGAVVVGFDAAGLPALTQALLDAGLGDRAVANVLGRNAIRLLRTTLPGMR